MKLIHLNSLVLCASIGFVTTYTNVAALPILSASSATSTQNLKPNFTDLVRQSDWSGAISALENAWKKAYEGYYGTERGAVTLTTPAEIGAVLERLGQESGQKSALVYLRPSKEQLEILLLIPGRTPIYKAVPSAAQAKLLPVAKFFYNAIKRSPSTVVRAAQQDVRYLHSAQQLYQWLIAPIEAELSAHQIDLLLFCMGEGLRSLPLAALHDGKHFLLERYNPVRIPAFNLVKTQYHGGSQNVPIAAFGAAQFSKQSELAKTMQIPPLPGVPTELKNIASRSTDRIFLNENFTMDTLQQVLATQHYPIVHLATHANFSAGSPQDSFILLWREELTLKQLAKLDWENSGVNLLVLSACQTALGEKNAELGFAGLAFQTGVDSVVASLWSVSDAGTVALMSEFYRHLHAGGESKAEALRQAQLTLLKNTSTSFQHPYFWAAFTLVGSPW